SDPFLGYAPVPAIVGQLSSGMPAKRAGLQKDDVILAVNGTAVHNWLQCVELIKKSGGATLKMDVLRGGKPLSVEIHPVQEKDEEGQLVWKIGVGPGGAWLFKPTTFGSAVKTATVETVDATSKLLGVLGKLFTGKLSVRQLQGFVGIAVRAGQAVQNGPV